MRLFSILLFLICTNAFSQLSKKHWIPPIHARDGQSTVLDHYIYLSTPEITPFQVSITTGNGTPINGSPFTISSGNPIKVLIGNSQPSVMFLNQNDVNIVKNNKGLILEANREFYATFKVRAENHAEILIGKGYQGIGTAFRLGSLPQSYDGTIRNFFSSFMATEDNTVVVLSDYDPNVEFVSPNGNITDDSQTFHLNKGESVTVSGYTNIPANLSGFVGALLTSDKPIAVNTGNAFAGMSTSQDGQDFTFDQIVPFEEIGNEYIVIKGNGSDNVEMPLIIATENNTDVFINGNPIPFTNLNAGEYVLIPTSMYQGLSSKNMHILSSRPIYVYQILGGSTYDATSGLNFIPPLSCYFQKKVDLIPSINTIGNTSYLSDIIALTYTGSTLTINGNPVSAVPQIVTGNPQWSTYKISGFTGNVVAESTGPLAVGMLGSSGAVGFAGYYSGFGSEPKDSNVAVCSDRNTDLFDLIEGNPDPGGTWTPPLASGTGVFNPNLDAPGTYVYNFTGLCEIVNVSVTVSVQQALNPGTSTNTEICKNAAPIDLFALLGPTAQTGGSWSPALASGGNIFDPAIDPAGTYTYSIISNDVCESVSATVGVTVNPLPITTLIGDFIVCDDTTDGDDTNGEFFFNLTTKTNEILNAQTGITVTYHTLQSDAENGSNAITGIQSGNRTIYVRLRNNLTGCYATTSFNLVVNPLPVVPATVTLKQCDDDQDAITSFNLTEANLLISTDPNLTFSYYEFQANALANTAPITTPTAYTSGNRTLWVRALNNSGCYSRVIPLNLVVSTTQIPQSFSKTLTSCDDYIDTADPENDGYAFFNLNDATQDIKNLFPAGQQPNLIVTYYENEADALAEENAISLTQPYRNITQNTQSVYVRVDSNISNNCEGLGAHLQLVVNPIPVFDLESDFVLCLNPVSGSASQMIDATPAVPGNYSYSWTPVNPNVDSDGNQSAQFEVNQAGTYTVLVTNTDTLCDNVDTVNVTTSSPPAAVAITLETPLFSSGLSTIQVIATGGFGQYEYSIDGGVNWQAEPVFSGLANDSYIVWVRDIAGCGKTPSDTFFTVTYPNFFTPNGDGYNDTWKIANLPEDFKAKIYIFDRYGKLIKEISPYGKGWDGTFNGNMLPATDYWFKVEYTQGGSVKEFKSHFSLKR